LKRSESRAANCVIISRRALAGANKDAVFAPTVARELPEPNLKQAIHRLSEFWLVALDDPSWFKPQMDIFTSDAQPWDQMDPSLSKFEQYPPAPTQS
jgi:hypothetical protein